MGKSARRIYDSINNAHILPQSGNAGTHESTGEPVIFDPSSMFGHNEAEWVKTDLVPSEILTVLQPCDRPNIWRVSCQFLCHIPRVFPED